MKLLRLAAFVLLAATLAVACAHWPLPKSMPTATPTLVPTTTPTVAPPTAPPTSTPTAKPTVVPTATPTVIPPTKTPGRTPTAQPTAEPRIILTEVRAQASTPGAIHVAGRARVFEGTVSLQLKDAAGKIIVRGAAQATMGAPEWGDFAADVFFPPPATPQQGTLEIFETSMKDGSPLGLVTMPVVLQPAPDLVKWKTFTNTAYSFQVKYPPTWYVNQGSFFPPPPATTKFSTYQVPPATRVLSSKDAEVWISVSDTPSLAEMQDLEKKGYQKTSVVFDSRLAVRYTDKAPHHGIYDVVYTIGGPHEFRLHLSAATHDFDALFVLFLATFNVTEQ
jgi:hypothetical protein